MCRLPIDKNSGRLSRARPASIYRFKVLKSQSDPKPQPHLRKGSWEREEVKQILGVIGASGGSRTHFLIRPYFLPLPYVRDHLAQLWRFLVDLVETVLNPLAYKVVRVIHHG